MTRVRLVWVWLFALMVAVMAGCGGDDSQTPETPDAAKDTKTDTTPQSDVKTDTTTDARPDTPTPDGGPDMTMPDARPDNPPDNPPPPPDVRPDNPPDNPPPPPDVRPDNPPPPPDVQPDNPPPPPDVQPDNPPPPPDADGGFVCTADNQCPNNKPHCNTTTGACVSATAVGVTPANPSIALGTKQQFTATITYSDNSTGPGTSVVTWDSSDTGKATIDTAGLATSVATGTTTITAHLGALQGSSVLTITAATLSSIAVTPSNPSIALGTTQQFVATGTFSDNTTQNLSNQVTWTSGTTSIATINGTGLASSVAKGSSVITATMGAVSGNTTLTVTDAILVSIAVTPASPTIPRFTALPMTATGTFTDNTTQNLTTQATWTSSNIAAATVSNTAGSQGLVTGTGGGTSTITATVGGVQGSTIITVTGPTLQTITITPANPTVAKGLVVPFMATGTYDNNTTFDLTTLVNWTSSDTAIAVISNAPGSQGVASTVGVGPTTITAAYGTVNGTTVLTVTAATLQSIAVTPTNPSIAKGTTQQFAATGTYTDNSTQDITSQVLWSSDNGSVASISNAGGSQGLATGVGQGDAMITATLNNRTGSTNLHVTNEVLKAIGITPANPTIAKGTDKQFVAIGTYTDNSTQNITTSVTWNSSDNAIATVSNAGGTQGRAHGEAVGAVDISASLNGIAGVTHLTVTNAALVAIAVTPATPSIPNGTTQPFVATGTYTDATTQNLTDLASWSSSNGGVATVSNTAGTRGVAHANGVGAANIIAAYQGVSGSTQLTVTPATLVSITVTPPSPTIAAGTTKQFVATGTYTDGSTQVITTQVLWESADTAIATVSNSGGSEGLATGVTVGEVNITATIGTTVGTAHLTVIQAQLVSVQVTPTTPSIPLGTTQQFMATGIYTAGPPIDLTTQVTWSSSATNVATISNAAGSEGEATALVAGSTEIGATINGVSGSTTLTVTSAALQSITVTPADLSVANGTQIQYKAIGNYTGGTQVDLTTQVTWDTLDHAKATVSNAGGSEGLASTTAVGGPFNVTATFASVTGQTSLTVTAATLSSITIAPLTPSIARGTTQQFVATGHYSDSTTQVLTAQVSWGSSNPSVVSISNASGTEGLATGVSPGMGITITASFGGKSGSTTMTVTSATLTSISVTPASGGINPGDTRQYQAVGTYSDATTQDITQLVTWDSSDTGVATISNAAGTRGLATGVAAGSATIKATQGAINGTATLTVN